MTEPRVVRAMTGGPTGRIAVIFVEWASEFEQRVVMDWALIANERDAQDVSQRILAAPRSFWGRTSISSAIEYSMALLARSPFQSDRQVIDVSGDGTNNSGADVSAVRDATIAKGVTINGLVILSDEPMPTNPTHTHPPGGLKAYYENNVIGGPGAFVMEAESFETFGQLIISKLSRRSPPCPTGCTGTISLRRPHPAGPERPGPGGAGACFPGRTFQAAAPPRVGVARPCRSQNLSQPYSWMRHSFSFSCPPLSFGRKSFYLPWHRLLKAGPVAPCLPAGTRGGCSAPCSLQEPTVPECDISPCSPIWTAPTCWLPAAASRRRRRCGCSPGPGHASPWWPRPSATSLPPRASGGHRSAAPPFPGQRRSGPAARLRGDR